MTVSSTESRIGYNGNGATTVFAFPYRFLTNTDLVVTLVQADTTQVVQTLNTDYTVSGAGDDAGGTVTMVVAPATGQQLIIVRDIELTQETDYISGDPFPAETHETALDKLTMISQRLNNLISRSIRLSDADLLVTSTILPAPVANATLVWNATGTALVNGVGTGEFVGLSSYMEVVLGSVDIAEAQTNLGVSAFVQTIFNDADAAAVRTTIDAASATGTTTNDNAAAGKVGEVLEAELVSGSATALTTATSKNVTSLPLAVGDYDVDAMIGFTIVNTSTIWQGSISQTSATQNVKNRDHRRVGTAGNLVGIYEAAVPSARISLAAPATLYLVAEATFASGSNAAYGWIRARRVR